MWCVVSCSTTNRLVPITFTLKCQLTKMVQETFCFFKYMYFTFKRSEIAHCAACCIAIYSRHVVVIISLGVVEIFGEGCSWFLTHFCMADL